MDIYSAKKILSGGLAKFDCVKFTHAATTSVTNLVDRSTSKDSSDRHEVIEWMRCITYSHISSFLSLECSESLLHSLCSCGLREEEFTCWLEEKEIRQALYDSFTDRKPKDMQDIHWLSLLTLLNLETYRSDKGFVRSAVHLCSAVLVDMVTATHAGTIDVFVMDCVCAVLSMACVSRKYTSISRSSSSSSSSSGSRTTKNRAEKKEAADDSAMRKLVASSCVAPLLRVRRSLRRLLRDAGADNDGGKGHTRLLRLDQTIVAIIATSLSEHPLEGATIVSHKQALEWLVGATPMTASTPVDGDYNHDGDGGDDDDDDDDVAISVPDRDDAPKLADWSTVFLGLVFLRCALADMERYVAGGPTALATKTPTTEAPRNAASQTGAKIAKSEKTTPVQNLPAMHPLEAVVTSGGLRRVCWLLQHRVALVRAQARALLRALSDSAAASEKMAGGVRRLANAASSSAESTPVGGRGRNLGASARRSAASLAAAAAHAVNMSAFGASYLAGGCAFWEALIEQGLVPVLDGVRIGTPVHTAAAAAAASYSNVQRGENEGADSSSLFRLSSTDAARDHSGAVAEVEMTVLFPEASTRALAKELLQGIAYRITSPLPSQQQPIAGVPSRPLRLRVLRDISGESDQGPWLRARTFAALVQLCALDSSVGAVVWAASDKPASAEGGAAGSLLRHTLEISCCSGSSSRPGDVKALVSICSKACLATLALARHASAPPRSSTSTTGASSPALLPGAPKHDLSQMPPVPQSTITDATAGGGGRSQDQVALAAVQGLSADERQNGGATLSVYDAEVGAVVKMQSPHVHVVAYIAPALAAQLTSAQKRARALATVPVGEDAPSPASSSSSKVVLAREDGTVEMVGSYKVWQEMLSHMGMCIPPAKGGRSQLPLLKQLLTAMPLPELLDAFCIARYFEAFPLIKRYRSTILQRLSIESFVRIFERALGKGLPRHVSAGSGGQRATVIAAGGRRDFSGKPDLWLLQRCLAFLDENMDALCDRSDPIRSQDVVALFHETIGTLFFA